MKNLQLIIVDDERLARVELEHMLKEYKVDVLASCGNSTMAIKAISDHKPDVVFLDINMPEKNGFEIAEEIDEDVHIVFVTAYDEYALRAFEVNALDYLVKPLDRSRLDTAIEKCMIQKEAYAFRLAQNLEKVQFKEEKKLTDHLFVKDSMENHFVKLDEISAFTSYGNYVKLCLSDKKILLHTSLNELEKRLEITRFFRANRYTIININHIETLLPTRKYKIRCKLINSMQIEFSERKSILFRKRYSA